MHRSFNSRAIQSNKTEQIKPIEPNRTPIVRLGSAIEQNREHLFCCEFDFRSNRTNVIEQNRTNPMQLSLDASN